MFFHPEGERGPARRNRDEAAKAVCLTCPVLAQCRAHALAVREPYGVWGGLTEDDREQIYAERQAGAPPSAEPRPSGADPTRPAQRRKAPSRRQCRRDVGPVLVCLVRTSVAVPVAVTGRLRASSAGSFFSTTSVSVVSTIAAIEAALRSAERVTLTGSMTPAAIRSPYVAGRRVEP